MAHVEAVAIESERTRAEWPAALLRRGVHETAAGLDVDGPAYREAGLAYMRLDETEINERLLADPRLLRLPLVRFGNEVSAGKAEGTWKAWLDKARTEGQR